MVQILFASKDYIAAYKPSGVPSVPLKNKKGGTFLEQVGEEYPEVLSVFGKNEWEGSAIHRLDTPTRGIILFARNQESYDWIISKQCEGRIIKRYRATLSGKRDSDSTFESFPYGDVIHKGGVISSYFRSYGVGAKAVRPIVDNPRFKKGRIYSTTIIPESDRSVICELDLGFRHQVRAHMAWAGYPLLGDTLYGGIDSDIFGLEAISIEFLSQKGERISITSQH